MRKQTILALEMVAFIGGCVASSDDVGGTVAEEEPVQGAEQELLPPPEDNGCDESDEYYYETTTYSSQTSYLWHCAGYSGWGTWYECNTYQQCQVVKVWSNYGMCVDGVLYGYKSLKSSTVSNNCVNASYATSGGSCPNPLYGGYCY